MAKFKEGDLVRRRDGGTAYCVGAETFTAVEVNSIGWVLDPDGQWHNHANLKRVKRTVEPTFESTVIPLGLGERIEEYLNELNDPEVEEDMVNHPSHYTSDPSGVECLTITRHRNFNIGNAMKYLWRNGLKEGGNLEKQVQDLQKAIVYINDEIDRLTNFSN